MQRKVWCYGSLWIINEIINDWSSVNKMHLKPKPWGGLQSDCFRDIWRISFERSKAAEVCYTVPLVDLIRETSAADSAPHSKHPHPSALEGPLVPPVLDLLEDVAASPLVFFVAFDLLHLFIQMKMSSIEEQQHTLNFRKLKKKIEENNPSPFLCQTLHPTRRSQYRSWHWGRPR